MRYLGNKTRMLNNIDAFFEKYKIDGHTFCDLFSGSGSVADHFKDRFQIIANDILASSSLFAKVKISNEKIPEFNKFKKTFRESPFDYFSKKEYKYLDSHFIWKNYSPEGNRQFFTEKVANKIDGIRIELDDLKNNKIISDVEYDFLLASLLETVMGLSNTTGTYEAFLKDWDSRAFKEFNLCPLEIEEKKLFSKENYVYCEDSNKLIESISGDILYLDTPYTITDYSSAYHLLETIVKYDKPEIRGITGRRVKKIQKSAYSIKNKVLEAYEDLIKKAKFKNIVISYSTQSLLPINELLSMLKKYATSEIIVEKYPYREYKNIRSSQKGDNLCEVLIYFKKESEVLKSPLNYSGSKNYIVDQIIDCLPDDISTFIDAMGGAFNVGVNISKAKNVVYNEYNPYVFDLVKYLLTEKKEKIIKDVEALVSDFELTNGNKEKYLIFRKYYNEHQTPLNLFVTQMYCFQNQLRFNGKHEFNTPVGNCGYNETITQRILEFKPKSEILELINLDFRDIEIDRYDIKSVFYFDPPYIITNATYNDGKRGFKGWTIEDEKELLMFLDKINDLGRRFVLSNVIVHKDKTNELLLNWVNKNNYRIINLKPHNGRYGARKEVLVVNF